MKKILPAHINKTLPALLAMFFVSSTFSMTNLTLFRNVLDLGWSNSFLGLAFTIDFISCILAFLYLLFKPRISLNRVFMFGTTLLIFPMVIALFIYQHLAWGWCALFLFQAAYSTFWHQNVRLILVHNASENEYARSFGLYVLMNLVGNLLGAVLFETFDNSLIIMWLIVAAYGVACLCLLFYPTYDKEGIHDEVFSLSRLQSFGRIIKKHPSIWIICLIAGYMGETFYTFISSYLEEVGVHKETALAAITAILLGGIAAKYPLSYFMDTMGKYGVSMVLIMVTCLLNAALSYVSPDSYILSLSFLLGGALYALTIVGDTFVASTSGYEDKQDASTISILIYFIGGLIGNALLGPAMDHVHVLALPVATAILAVIMGGCILGLRSHARQKAVA